MPDVAMTEAAPAETEAPQAAGPTLADVDACVALVRRGVAAKDARVVARTFRGFTAVRRGATAALVRAAVAKHMPAAHAAHEVLTAAAAAIPAEAGEDAEMPAPSSEGGAEADEEADAAEQALPETATLLAILTATALMKRQRHEDAAALLTWLAGNVLATANRRTLDALAARAYQYLSLAYERLGRLSAVRSTLMAAYRTACVQHNAIGQATLLNLLLRSLLAYSLVDQAFRLLGKTSFPQSASNNQLCRHLYYLGRMECIQLDYASANVKLLQCLRKAPQHAGLDFRVAAQKLGVVVRLLMGEIPERAIFAQADMRAALKPYFELTRSVGLGDVALFQATVAAHGAAFRRDGLFQFVQRLEHTVVKSGLRNINTAYSRISFADIAAKLRLESAQTAEFVCAKAIRDGVIDATLDNAGGFMFSRATVDVYGTLEPQQAFNKRIAFCLDVHNEAVRAMQYPPNAYRKAEEAPEEAPDAEDELEEDDELKLDGGPL